MKSTSEIHRSDRPTTEPIGEEPPTQSRLSAWLFFPYDQTLLRVKGRGSPTHPGSPRINIAPELIQFPDNTASTKMKSFQTAVDAERRRRGEANRMKV